MKLYIEKSIMQVMTSYDEELKKNKEDIYSLFLSNYFQGSKLTRKVEFRITGYELDKIYKRAQEEEKSLVLDDIDYKKVSNNIYEISTADEPNHDNIIYALVSGLDIIAPDDVYIPSKMKKSVKVIKHIKLPHSVVDYGGYLSNIYFVKVTLRDNQSIPFYYERVNTKLLAEHVTFANPSWHKTIILENLETYILLGKDNKNDFISLSELSDKK